MKLHHARADGRNLFTGYGPGYVSINGARRQASTVVLSDRVLEWELEQFDALSHQAFVRLAALPVEITTAARCRNRPGSDGHQRGLPHLQHPAGRGPPGGGGAADRGWSGRRLGCVLLQAGQ